MSDSRHTASPYIYVCQTRPCADKGPMLVIQTRCRKRGL